MPRILRIGTPGRIAGTLRRARLLARAGFRRESVSLLWSRMRQLIGSMFRKQSRERTSRLVGRIGKEKRTLPTRMLFLLGDFEAAMEQALLDIESHPDDVVVRMYIVGCAIEMADFECAERQLALVERCVVPDDVSHQLPFFRYTLERAREGHDSHAAIRQTDSLFLSMGCRPVRFAEVHRNRYFDALDSDARTVRPENVDYFPLSDGPLVSVVMTAYNVEDLIETSVMSILKQSYRNLELIVVDDCSTDGTLETLRAMESEHDCMQVITRATNDGTYVSKNTGIRRARGKYIAFQDSDDWSHPDRIGKSIAVLEGEPDLVAVTTDWVRMTTDGGMVIQNKNQYAYRACISLVYDRSRVLPRAGYFDCVRAEADGEFLARMFILFGEDRVVNFPWPLSFGRIRPESLTSHPEFGLVRGRGAPVREEYRNAYRGWHRKIEQGGCGGYMPFPLDERRFEAPGVMLP